MKTKIQIKTTPGKVLFEYEKENNTIKDTLEEAAKSGADLRGANLCGAYLGGADLRGANLCGAYLGGADLRGAYLCGADLSSADLRSADLRGANLCGAYLGGADLRGAYLCGADLGGANLCGADLRGVDLRGAYLCGADLGDWGKLQSSSDILQVGTIGSRNGYTTIFHTDKGVFVQCGCFRGTLDEFEAKVKETHQGNKHERDYLALIEFVKVKFRAMNREEQIKLYCEEMGFPMGSCSSINSVKAQTAADAIRWADEHPRRTTDWNQVRIQAAIAAMQGTQANAETMEALNHIAQGNDKVLITIVAAYSVECADALVKKLKGE